MNGNCGSFSNRISNITIKSVPIDPLTTIVRCHGRSNHPTAAKSSSCPWSVACIIVTCARQLERNRLRRSRRRRPECPGWLLPFLHVRQTAVCRSFLLCRVRAAFAYVTFRINRLHLLPSRPRFRNQHHDVPDLVPNGLGEPEEPAWGSWAGRYGRRDGVAGNRYYWANEADNWQGMTNRDNTLRRWAAHLQNDFRARLDWCVKPFDQANHPPQVVVNGLDGTKCLRLPAAAGSELKLDASASRDPDGDHLSYEWFVYPEPGTYRGIVTIAGTNTGVSTVRIPDDASGHTIHVLLTVTDNGQPPLTRYRRTVITVGRTDEPPGARAHPGAQ
jgi:hypothetical protein